MVLPSHIEIQVPLIHVVESDDLYLQSQGDVLWFELLRELDWVVLRPVAARYYEALWQFNEQQAQARRQRADALPPNLECQDEATLRLLFERATLDEDVPVLHHGEHDEPVDMAVEPQSVRPGRVPVRLAGRAPKCFFAMLKAFMGVTVSGAPPEPAVVRAKLVDNPAFARTCGFTLPDPKIGYRQSDVPSLRKLEQFDQIMSANGLWGEAALAQVRRNLETGRVKIESTVVHDTTHYQAFSSMQVVDLPKEEASTAGPTDRPSSPSKSKRQRAKRKSHPRTTKSCRCQDRTICPHDWVSADEGAGTVVKSSGKKYWAHKASTMSFAKQEILLDAVAMTDAASHDSQSLAAHVGRLLERYPELEGKINRVLDDGAADDQTLKDFFWDECEIELLAPINPRGRRPITDNLPRGIDHLTSTGTPVCQAGYPMDLIGCRHDTERFLFRAPDDEAGVPVCQQCALRHACYRGQQGARQVTIPFARLPWLDPQFPQLSKRFAKVMARRTVIERLHKLMKFDYGDDRLSKRGNDAFQARLDKTLLAMHLVLAHC